MPTFNDFQSRDTAVGRNQDQPQRDGGAQTQFTNMSYAEQQDSWQKMQKKTTADSLPNVDVVFEPSEKLRDPHALHRDRRDTMPNQREQHDRDRRDTAPNQREQFERKLPPINPNKLDKPDQQEKDDDCKTQTSPRRRDGHRHAPVRFVGE